MIAIYARQSVDKKDSISIETQIETCRRKLKPEEDNSVIVYSDKGFSGKNTNRPNFQEMLNSIKQNEINKIIVYKVDRISRSMYDFLTMKKTFDQYNVEFISCLEDFDTSTATGKMMLNLVMMFAEMEREAIQKRITDNYYARGEKGLYLGGCAPIGYIKVPVYLDGKKTYKFEISAEEEPIIVKVFNDFVNLGKGTSTIAKELNNSNVETKRNGMWTDGRVKSILKNPVYAKANADIYTFFKSKGTIINNPIEDFNGEFGCYFYGQPSTREHSKFLDYGNNFISLGMHSGIIDSDTWIAVQIKFENQKAHSNLGYGKTTWLQGLVKCQSCKFSCYTKSHTNHYKKGDKTYVYFYCKGKRFQKCEASRQMMRVDRLEEIVAEEILKKITELQSIEYKKASTETPQITYFKIEISKIEQKISNLISQLSQGAEITIKYINDAIQKLDFEKSKIENSLIQLQYSERRKSYSELDLKYIFNNWNSMSLDDKKNISKILIKEVLINGNETEIYFF